MARSPNIDKAKELYKQGMKLVDIANKLNVPPGTVRRWKSTYKWDSEQSERSHSKNERSPNSVKVNKEKKKVVVDEVKEVINNPELTDKQRLFCLYYSKSFNATRSYQKAYGCTYDSAMALGPKLLGNVRVKDEIMRLKEERYSRAFLKEEDIFQKYMDIAFADMTDYVNMHNETLKDEIDGTIVTEVSFGKTTKIKLADRMKALQWLTDHMDLATEEQRARIAALKAKSQDPDEEEVADDGFLDALNGSAREDWLDEES